MSQADRAGLIKGDDGYHLIMLPEYAVFRIPRTHRLDSQVDGARGVLRANELEVVYPTGERRKLEGLDVTAMLRLQIFGSTLIHEVDDPENFSPVNNGLVYEVFF